MTEFLINFLEIPHVDLDNLPICPFVKNVRIKNKIQFEIYEFTNNVDAYIENLLRNFVKQEHYEALWLINPNKKINYQISYDLVVNMQSLLCELNLLAFGGGPNDNYRFKNIQTRNEPYVNIVVQSQKVLNNARNILMQTNYYEVK